MRAGSGPWQRFDCALLSCTRVPALGAGSQNLGGGLIGGEERLQMQFCPRDVCGGGDRRQGGDEAQFAVVGVQSQRNGEPEVSGAWIGWRELALQLGDECVQLWVGAEPETRAQGLGDVTDRIPEHLKDAEAASLTCAGVVAWAALTKPVPVGPGETVLTVGTGTVGMLTLPKSVACGAFNARVTLIGAFPGPQSSGDPFGGKYLSIGRIAVGSRADFEALNRAIALNGTRPVIDRVFQFDEAVEAHRYFRDGDPFGKVVVRSPCPTPSQTAAG